MTNRRSHIPIRLVPKSATLDDLERPMRTLLQKRCVFRSPPQKIGMKTEAYCQRQNCRPMSLVSGGVRFMRRFPGEEGVSKNSGVVENGSFQRFCRIFLNFGSFIDEASVIAIHRTSSAFQ